MLECKLYLRRCKNVMDVTQNTRGQWVIDKAAFELRSHEEEISLTGCKKNWRESWLDKYLRFADDAAPNLANHLGLVEVEKDILVEHGFSEPRHTGNKTNRYSWIHFSTRPPEDIELFAFKLCSLINKPPLRCRPARRKA